MVQDAPTGDWAQVIACAKLWNCLDPVKPNLLSSLTPVKCCRYIGGTLLASERKGVFCLTLGLFLRSYSK